jgi:hypothetical protein
MARFTHSNNQMVMDEPSSVTKANYVYFSWCRCPHRHTCTDFQIRLLDKDSRKSISAPRFFAKVQTTSLYE